MNEKTLTALKRSIAHWKRYVDGKGFKEGVPESHNCHLCKLFFHQDCHGCPVAEKTKEAACLRTPYSKAHEAYINHGPTSKKFIAAAKRQLKFLTSLLPK